MTQGAEPHLLARRLAALRRRLRVVTGLRGASLLVTTLVAGAALAGLLDWRAHLPGAVRAALLVAGLGAAGVVAYRFLFRPLQDRTDDLSLALRVEERYPELNDCLASTVQFLGQPEAVDRSASAALRKAAVRGALLKAEGYDFNKVVDRRGVVPAGLSLVLSLGLGAALLLLFPGVARTALLRLAVPFGAEEWPSQTRFVDQTAKARLARGEAFEVRGTVEGVIPEKATVSFWFEGMPPTDVPVTVVRKDATAGIAVRLDGGRVQHTFRYRVTANDAQTPWREVTVLPPPALVALGGRLVFPAYTDLPERRLPDGAYSLPPDAPDTIDGAMPAGTRVVLRGTADRPLARAWLEYRPESPDEARPELSPLKAAAALGPLGATHPTAALALTAGGHAVWGRVPAAIDRDGRSFTVNVRPYVSGDYALCLEGETGLVGGQLLRVRVAPDPTPVVELRRPSASFDSLALLPDADVALHVSAKDEKYAVRSVYLEYRCGKDEKPRRLSLYHHQTAGAVVPQLAAALGAAPLPLPQPALRPRPPALAVAERLPMKLLKHADGRPLREGDAVTLIVYADDFDDVALDKKPGRSHEVELRVVSLPALEAVLNQAQAQVQQDLLRQRELQRQAIKKVADLEKQWRNTGQLSKKDEEELEQAMTLQEQVRARLGTEEEGLRAEVGRIQRALKDNHLPRSGAHERMEALAEELDRLAAEELGQINPLLDKAAKDRQTGAEKAPPDKGKRGPLAEALEHQEEVEKTLSEMLARLEPWSTTREVKGETRALLEEQRRLEAEAEKLARETPPGTEPKALTPEQRANLEKAAEWQNRLAEHLDQLLNKMERVGQEKAKLVEDRKKQARERELLALEKEKRAQALKNKDPDLARQLLEEARDLKKEAERLREEAEAVQQEVQTLQQAAEAGRSKNVPGTMKQAAQQVGKNQLGKARQNQQNAAGALEEVAKALDDRREEELDRAIKKLRDAEKEMERLAKEQDLLQKKIKDAQKLKDPEQRAAELHRLTREQEKLRKDAHELSKQLSRLRAERAREALSRAGAQMEEAGQELERGRNPDEPQDEALDRLDEAREELKKAREQAEEELAREKLAKVADQLKRLKERQEALLPEAERIQRELLAKKAWGRGLLASLNDLARAQEGLAKETRGLSEGKLKEVLVFARVLGKSADAMEQAAEAMRRHSERGKEIQGEDIDVELETAAAKEIEARQRLALERLQLLVESLKTESRGGARNNGGAGGRNGGGSSGGAGGTGGDGGAGGSHGGGDGIPHLAQLRALKALQEEVNRRTEEFAKKHPDADRLTDPQKKELETIRKDQAEVADLLQQLTAPADEGGKP